MLADPRHPVSFIYSIFFFSKRKTVLSILCYLILYLDEVMHDLAVGCTLIFLNSDCI